VTIEEYYTQSDMGGPVLRTWRFEGMSNWHSIKTTYAVLPHDLFEVKADPKDFEKDVDSE
jgi:hypothetical protein